MDFGLMETSGNSLSSTSLPVVPIVTMLLRLKRTPPCKMLTLGSSLPRTARAMGRPMLLLRVEGVTEHTISML